MATGPEGLWVSPAGPTQGLAFIDQTNKYLGFSAQTATVAPLLYDAAWDVTGSNWTFAAGSINSNVSGGIAFVSGVYGSGTFTQGVQVQGAYTLSSPSGPTTPLQLDYSVANALAASASDLVGTWASSGITVQIDAGGAVTGTASGTGFNACSMTGVVTPPPGSKNFFSVNVVLSDVTPGSCFTATQFGPYQGYGAITFLPISGSALSMRSLTFLVRTSNQRWFAAELVKQ